VVYFSAKQGIHSLANHLALQHTLPPMQGPVPAVRALVSLLAHRLFSDSSTIGTYWHETSSTAAFATHFSSSPRGCSINEGPKPNPEPDIAAFAGTSAQAWFGHSLSAVRPSAETGRYPSSLQTVNFTCLLRSSQRDWRPCTAYETPRSRPTAP
jgi:hypothetical protein